MDNILHYIIEQALILVPVLYLIGMAIKRIPSIPDWIIPFALGALGIAGACALMGFGIDGILQGILCAGAAVLTNQTIKQATKRDAA